MKKFVFWGLALGLAVSAAVILLRRKQFGGREFHEFFDSSTVADEWFSDAFDELPDTM